MKKLYLILFLILAVLYLNRAYAHIYQIIGSQSLKPPPQGSQQLFTSATTNAKINFLALGDSLTAGVGLSDMSDSYLWQLSQKLNQNNFQVNLINYGLPGAKTNDVLKQLNDIPIEADIITVMIGVNDIHNQTKLEDFKKNYQAIIDRLKTSEAKIYLIAIPYIGSKSLLLPPYNYYFSFKAKQFNNIIFKLAQDNKINFIDINQTSSGKLNIDSSMYSSDQFHPGPLIHKIWSNLIYDHLNF